MEPRIDDLDELIAHEPFVRSLARKLVLDGVRADDVVQQTWLAALCADRTRIVSLRGWLAAIVRRVAATSRRAEARAERRERLAARPEAELPADDARTREDARRAIVDAVFGLEEPWRTTLILRHLDGVAQREIARRMNVPVETVHSRLRRGLELLRQRLDADHDGDRRAWLLGLVPFAAQTGTISIAVLSSAAIHGVLVMLMQFKAVVVAAAVAAVGLFWFTTTDSTPVEPPHPYATSRASEPATTDGERSARIEADAAERTVVPGALEPATTVALAPSATTGSIEVSLRTREPLADAAIVVQVAPSSSSLSRPARQPVVSGSARFDGLEPGNYTVSTDRFVETTCVVESGETVQVTLDTTSGYGITGRVLGPDGVAVEGATITLSRFGQWQEGFDVARSGEGGSYVVDGVGIGTHVGASKSGFAASRMRFVFAGRGEPRNDIDLELRPSGGAIAGRVLDAIGAPLADARIVVDADGIAYETRDDGTSHLNVFERFAWSAADGTFFVDGLIA
ncbi:MAG: sigma-70 family RNA polymerase sigma factor, partial [Planctomycetes bacterium]|nr:sigma-70 family RNA polymerase sigma factor [Planctomycetota bacterium]